MTRRYYVPDLPATGGRLPLPDPESQHALRVMRLQPGDEIILFDGRGREAEAVVVETGKQHCWCKAKPAAAVDRELGRAIHLAVALPKPDRCREMIQRLAELGVRQVTPLVAQRTQRGPGETLLEKLRRTVIEASKQCGRNELMQIGPPQQALGFFRAPHVGARWVAHPEGDPLGDLLEGKPTSRSRPAAVVAAVGPEGGFTADEIRTAGEQGFQSIGLGRRIYRIETAAVVIASVLSLEHSDE